MGLLSEVGEKVTTDPVFKPEVASEMRVDEREIECRFAALEPVPAVEFQGQVAKGMGHFVGPCDSLSMVPRYDLK